MLSQTTVAVFLTFIVAVQGGDNYGGLTKPLDQLKSTLSQEQLNQAKTIIENPSITKQEIKNQLAQYFQKLGEPFYSKYQAASKTFENQIANSTAKAEAMKSSLSKPAQLLVDKIMAIHKDMTITPAQEKQQIKALVDQATPDVRQELEKAKANLQQKTGETIGNPEEFL